MLNCTNTDPEVYQSPWAVDSTQAISDWSSDDNISFLTAWEAPNVSPDDLGFSDYTYRINTSKDGDFGVFYAIDPSQNTKQIIWQVTQIRFKYGAEHTFDDY